MSAHKHGLQILLLYTHYYISIYLLSALLETSHAYYARRDRLLAKQQRRAERAKLRLKLSVPPDGNVVQASQDSAPCFTFANETAALYDDNTLYYIFPFLDMCHSE